MATLERRSSTNLKRRVSNGPSVTVHVTAGPCTGQEYPIQSQETVIGRQAGCDIVISDISVSRKHVSIAREGAAYILRDLGSGNGTYYEGEPIAPEGIELHDGALVKIGDTELTFSMTLGHRVSPRTMSREGRRALSREDVPRSGTRQRAGRSGRGDDDVPSRRRNNHREEPKKSKLKAVGFVVVALALIGLFAKVAIDKQKAAQEAAAENAVLREQEEAILGAIAEVVDKGRAATRKGEFKQAIVHFEEATKLAAEHERELPRDVQRNLDYAKKEVAFQDLMDKSRELAKGGKLGEAAQELAKITEDSFFYGTHVDELKAEFKVYFPDYISKAKQLLAAKEFDAAQEAVEEVLAIDQKDASATQMQAEIERAAQLAKRPVKKKEEQVVQKEDVTAPILAVFYKGQLEVAIEQAKACSDADCAKLLAKLEAFNAAYAEVEDDTEKAFSTLMAIPGAKKSSFYTAIGSKIATTLTKSGIREMGSENYAAAFKAFQKALSIDAGNNVARKHMVTIHHHAQELFQQAYVEKAVDPESARRHFEKVLTMTDSSDELNQKAKRQLKSLSGGY